MKRQWTREELAEHWTLDQNELALLANKAGPTRLGFAVLRPRRWWPSLCP